MVRFISHGVRAHAAARRLAKGCAPITRLLLSRRFSSQARVRVLIFHHPNRICWASIYPYFHYAAELADRYGADIRARPLADIHSDKAPAADVILVQPWFTEDMSRLAEAIARYRARHDPDRVVFLDSAAHVDLRAGRALDPVVDLYLRKALFRDRKMFQKPRLGDTNLTEYYMELHGIPGQVVDRRVPDGLLTRLGLSPNFLVAPHLMPHFLMDRPDTGARPIDLHSRIATGGTPWYQAMRSHAAAVARDMPGIKTTPQERISQPRFLKELRQSKLCWSPFGYGELCWRDIEAFMTGAVLVKPDMSHLDSLPDLYRPNETYLPVRWDFSDFGDVVRQALAQPEILRRIAATAFDACSDYLAAHRFVEDCAPQLSFAR